MKIELNLVTDIDEDGDPILVDLETAVTEAVAERLSRQIQNKVFEQVKDVATKAIQAQVKEWITVALTKLLQKTDGYGKSQGEPISFETYATKIIDSYMVEKLNVHGRSSYDGVPRIEAMVKDQAKALLEKHVKAALEEHRGRMATVFVDVLIESAAKLGAKVK